MLAAVDIFSSHVQKDILNRCRIDPKVIFAASNLLFTTLKTHSSNRFASVRKSQIKMNNVSKEKARSEAKNDMFLYPTGYLDTRQTPH